jgi:hypothetical protein
VDRSEGFWWCGIYSILLGFCIFLPPGILNITKHNASENRFVWIFRWGEEYTYQLGPVEIANLNGWNPAEQRPASAHMKTEPGPVSGTLPFQAFSIPYDREATEIQRFWIWMLVQRMLFKRGSLYFVFKYSNIIWVIKLTPMIAIIFPEETTFLSATMSRRE